MSRVGRQLSAASILTIAELLAGKGIAYPHYGNVTFKRAPMARGPETEQLTLAPTTEARAPAKRKRH